MSLSLWTTQQSALNLTASLLAGGGMDLTRTDGMTQKICGARDPASGSENADGATLARMGEKISSQQNTACGTGAAAGPSPIACPPTSSSTHPPPDQTNHRQQPPDKQQRRNTHTTALQGLDTRAPGTPTPMAPSPVRQHNSPQLALTSPDQLTPLLLAFGSQAIRCGPGWHSARRRCTRHIIPNHNPSLYPPALLCQARLVNAAKRTGPQRSNLVPAAPHQCDQVPAAPAFSQG